MSWVKLKKSKFELERKMFGKTYRNTKTDELLSVGVFYPDAHVNIPSGYSFSVHSAEQARKGYPNNFVGISKKEALRLSREYRRRN